MTTTTHAECLIPGNHLMAGLLGTRDELLRQVEQAFPDEKIAVQGNRITVEGPDADRVVRLFDEAVLLLQSGQSLDNSTMSRTIDMVRDDVRPSDRKARPIYAVWEVTLACDLACRSRRVLRLVLGAVRPDRCRRRARVLRSRSRS